jgi:hypothetical protein
VSATVDYTVFSEKGVELTIFKTGTTIGVKANTTATDGSTQNSRQTFTVTVCDD